jgi:hypothetical protein
VRRRIPEERFWEAWLHPEDLLACGCYTGDLVIARRIGSAGLHDTGTRDCTLPVAKSSVSRPTGATSLCTSVALYVNPPETSGVDDDDVAHITTTRFPDRGELWLSPSCCDDLGCVDGEKVSLTHTDIFQDAQTVCIQHNATGDVSASIKRHFGLDSAWSATRTDAMLAVLGAHETTSNSTERAVHDMVGSSQCRYIPLVQGQHVSFPHNGVNIRGFVSSTAPRFAVVVVTPSTDMRVEAVTSTSASV